jgi:tight adherence protein B
LVSFFALIGVTAVSAQADDPIFLVREIDGTEQKAVALTLLWTGEPTSLQEMTIRENGAAVKVDDLVDLRQTDRRLATVFVVDLSGSMADDGALAASKASIAEIADNLPEGDQLALVSFANDAVVESSFTSSPDQIKSALEGMAAPRDGRTAMYDGIRKAVTLFESRPGLQPNVVLVTDGSDDVSSTDLAGARASVASSGAAFFAVELTHMEGEVDTGAIDSIIERAGGASFSGTSAAEIGKAFDDVMATMRSQFVATYASKVEQGAVDVEVTIAGQEIRRNYVAGGRAEGAGATQVVTVKKAFGPDWLRSTPILPVLVMGLAIGLGVYALVQLAGSSNTGLSAVLSPYTEGTPADADNNDQALAQTAFLQRAVEMTEDFAERQGFLEKVSRLLERADLPLRAAEALFFYVAGVVLVGLMGLFGLGLIAGLVLGVLAALVPVAVVSFMAGMRARKFVGQLPDTLSLLSGSLRAGYSLMQGVEAVSQEVEDPMGKELRRVVTEARLGRELESSLDGVAERMSSPDFAWAVMAIRIQREVGGNLAELLMTVSETMVQRDRLRRDVNSLTAEGRMSAIILALLPIGLGLFMWASNPEYMSPLGNTGMGQALLGLATVSALIGFVWMKKTITIEI